MGIAGYLLFVVLLVTGVLSLAAAVVVLWRREGPGPNRWSGRAAGLLAAAAVGWTVLVGIGLLLIPTGTTTSVEVSESGGTTTTTSSRSLLASEGAGIVVVVLIPVGIAVVGALVPELARWRWAGHVRIGAGVLLTAFAIVGLLSIGILYLPAAVLLLVAGIKGSSTRRTGPTRAAAPTT